MVLLTPVKVTDGQHGCVDVRPYSQATVSLAFSQHGYPFPSGFTEPTWPTYQYLLYLVSFNLCVSPLLLSKALQDEFVYKSKNKKIKNPLSPLGYCQCHVIVLFKSVTCVHLFVHKSLRLRVSLRVL